MASKNQVRWVSVPTSHACMAIARNCTHVLLKGEGNEEGEKEEEEGGGRGEQ
jgi:hypothetical protein